MLKFFNKMKKNKKGFTLTELIIVVAILGVLAGIATPMVIGYVNDAKVKADKTSSKAIEDSIKRAIAKSDTSLAITSSAADIKTAINAEFKTIPVAAQGSTYHFVINKTTGEVNVKLNSLIDPALETDLS